MERAVCEVDGVRSARASAQTRNLLIHFDQRRIDQRTLLERLESMAVAYETAMDADEFVGPRSESTHAIELGRAARDVIREVGRFRRRVQIPLPGLDRDPALARKAVDRLSRLPGVARVTVSHLTGRMLVEYSERQIDIEDLLAELTKLDLPELPGEDLGDHPLDPVPLIESTARTVGAGLGLTLPVLRRALGAAGPPPGGERAAQFAGTIGIVEGMPPVTERLERAIGHRATQLAIGATSIVSLTFAENALGLAVSAAGTAGLMAAVRARRARWKEYEERTGEAGPPNPGARIDVPAGQRVPLAATVVSGNGTAVCRSGATIEATPGTNLDAGTVITDGVARVLLSGEREFSPQPRQASPVLTLYDRYLRAVPPASLAYAAALGIASHSLSRLSAALLLVNPRAALIGAANADNAATSRALRAGLTVVGTRERRPLVKPDALIIESARVLVDTARTGRQTLAAPGLPALVEGCRRYGVHVEVASEHTPEVAEIAGEAGLAISDEDALVRIRTLQAQGTVVAVLGDGGHAAHEFAEADLAIGLTDPREGSFAGRADLLVPNLESVAMLVEIGARRGAAVSDSVLASALANLVGAAWGIAGDPAFSHAAQATYAAALVAIADGCLRLRGDGLTRLSAVP